RTERPSNCDLMSSPAGAVRNYSVDSDRGQTQRNRGEYPEQNTRQPLLSNGFRDQPLHGPNIVYWKGGVEPLNFVFHRRGNRSGVEPRPDHKLHVAVRILLMRDVHLWLWLLGQPPVPDVACYSDDRQPYRAGRTRIVGSHPFANRVFAREVTARQRLVDYGNR